MKTRKFARGDDVEGSDEGSADASSASEESPKSRFSEDTYARARKYLEGGSEEAPKAAPKAAPKRSPAKEEAPKVASAKPIAKPPIRRPVKDPTVGEAKEGPAAQLAADKMGDTNPRDAEKGMSRGRPAITGEIANLDSRAVRDRKTAQMMTAQDEKLRQKRAAERLGMNTSGMKKGGAVKKFASGGSVSSRADGCAQRGKTRGKMV